MAFLGGPRLLDWASSPPHLQFNRFVLTGYRPVSSGPGCLRSLFYLHNELGNIYTHGEPPPPLQSLPPRFPSRAASSPAANAPRSTCIDCSASCRALPTVAPSATAFKPGERSPGVQLAPRGASPCSSPEVLYHAVVLVQWESSALPSFRRRPHTTLPSHHLLPGLRFLPGLKRDLHALLNSSPLQIPALRLRCTASPVHLTGTPMRSWYPGRDRVP